MPTSEEIKKLYKEKQYTKIIELIRDTTALETMNEWNCFYYMSALKNLQKYDDCITVYHRVVKRFSNSNIINNVCGWAVYHKHIKNFNKDTDDKNVYIKQLEYFIARCEYKEYSPLMTYVKRYLKIKLDKDSIPSKKNYEDVNACLDRLNPAELLDEEAVYNGVGKVYKGESDRELWYRCKIKVLEKLGQNDACIKLAREFLQNVKIFHNNSDLWVNYYVACSFYNLEAYGEARKIVNDAIKSGLKHYCALDLLFKINKEDGKVTEAIRRASECALVDNSHNMRVNFYPAFAEYLYEQGFKKEAMMLRQFNDNIIAEHSWKPKSMNVKWKVEEEIAEMSTRDLLHHLKKFWLEQRDAGIEFLNGRVKRMLPSGKDGFITSEDGKDYYFNVRDIEEHRKISENDNVRFVIDEKYDKKHGKMKLCAVKINVVK